MNTAITDTFFTAVVNEPLVALNLWVSRGVAAKTRRADSDRLKPFLKNFSKLTEISSTHIDDWLESLKDRLNYNSRVSHSESIRGFFNWCIKDNRIILSTNPASHLRLRRTRKARNKAANEKDIKRLITFLTNDLANPASCRDLLAIQLYYESGCRLREVSTLTTKAVNEALRNGVLNQGGVVIYTAFSDEGKKGSVPVRFTEHTAAIYKEWLNHRPSPGTNRVFTSLLHKKSAIAVKPEALSTMIARRCQQIGIVPFRTHAIRHLKGTKTADEYGPAVAAAMLNISFEVAQTHYYNAVETAVLNATG